MSKIAEKVRKLWSLANSPNEHEANAAKVRALALMTKHGLEHGDLEEQGEIQFWTEEPLEKGPTIPDWQQSIAGAVAERHACVSLVSAAPDNDGSIQMVLAGRRGDFEQSTDLYRWLVDQIVAAAIRDGQVVSAMTSRTGLPRRWYRSFKEGAAATIEHELQRKKAERVLDEGVVTALVRQYSSRTEEVVGWALENIEQRPAVANEEDVDTGAFHRGCHAGRLINVAMGSRVAGAAITA